MFISYWVWFSVCLFYIRSWWWASSSPVCQWRCWEPCNSTLNPPPTLSGPTELSHTPASHSGCCLCSLSSFSVFSNLSLFIIPAFALLSKQEEIVCHIALSCIKHGKNTVDFFFYIKTYTCACMIFRESLLVRLRVADYFSSSVNNYFFNILVWECSKTAWTQSLLLLKAWIVIALLVCISLLHELR